MQRSLLAAAAGAIVGAAAGASFAWNLAAFPARPLQASSQTAPTGVTTATAPTDENARPTPATLAVDSSGRTVPEAPIAAAPAAVPAATNSLTGPLSPVAAQAPAPAAAPLRIICFGAHPDDCELQAAGSAAKWARQGAAVKFVSVTNGDIGHWAQAGGPLASRRTAEVQRTAEILGITAEVLDIHDGELLPTLENRKTITKLIREWKADIVMCHRPNDYHPDHRNVGLLVQDAAYMVTVPFFCPDVPPLAVNPAFFYYEDRFQKPNPFVPDVVVDIDDVLELKLACVEALESQFYEGGCCSGISALPETPEAVEARKREVRQFFERDFAGTADRFRDGLRAWYGGEHGARAGHAEAFELCEYGRQPTRDELRRMFPVPQQRE